VERPASSALSTDATDPLATVRQIAEDTDDVVANVRRERRASSICSANPDASERMDRLDERFAALRARSSGDHPAVLSGARMLLASARACTSCSPVELRHCQQFDGELAELRRSLDR
jgi:hypothetical protein